MTGIDPTIVTIALAAAAIAKILVDLVRATQRLPAWASPLLALIFSIIAAFLLQVAGGAPLTIQIAAVSTLAGVLAAGTAVGSTELQKRGKEPAYLAVIGEALETLVAPVAVAPVEVAIEVAPVAAAPAEVAPVEVAPAAVIAAITAAAPAEVVAAIAAILGPYVAAILSPGTAPAEAPKP